MPSVQLNNTAATLEANGLSANSSLNGQLFNRQAFVGLSDKQYGSIALARNCNQIYDVVSEYDPVQKSDLFSLFCLSGTFGGGGGKRSGSGYTFNVLYTENNFGVQALLVAKYKMGDATIKGGWERYDLKKHLIPI